MATISLHHRNATTNAIFSLVTKHMHYTSLCCTKERVSYCIARPQVMFFRQFTKELVVESMRKSQRAYFDLLNIFLAYG